MCIKGEIMANLIGKKYGKLTVISRYGTNKFKQVMW
jgi:hypothetical protein